MSFLDNPKTAGTAFEIVGLLEVIGGIFAIIGGIIDEEIDTGFAVVVGIGAIICGLIVFFFGAKVLKGEISAKIDILATFVRVVGVTSIISGIFLLIGMIMISGDIVGPIISIVIGLIIVFISTKINDGKQTTGDKIIWILLLIFFILDLIGAILTIIGGFNPFSITQIITGICSVIIYIFMLILLFDSDVKKEMGM
jgi:hypothetical protein